MSNLDLGVRRAMVASLVAAGVSLDSALIRITDAKVAAGTSYIKDRFDDAKRRLKDEETCWDQAFQDLKRWVISNV